MAPFREDGAPFWTRPRRLFWAFLVGPLIILAGVYYWLTEGLNFYAGWYFLIGGLLVAFGLRDLLTDHPPRTREDALRVFAHLSTLLILLLVGGLSFVVMTAISYVPWPDSLLRFVIYAAFFLLLFVYARRWETSRAAGLSTKER